VQPSAGLYRTVPLRVALAALLLLLPWSRTPFVRGQSFPWHVPPPPAIAGLVCQSLAPHRLARAPCASALLVRARCRLVAARQLMVTVREFFTRARCRPVAAPASAALAPFAPSLSQHEAGAEPSAAEPRPLSHPSVSPFKAARRFFTASKVTRCCAAERVDPIKALLPSADKVTRESGMFVKAHAPASAMSTATRGGSGHLCASTLVLHFRWRRHMFSAIFKMAATKGVSRTSAKALLCDSAGELLLCPNQSPNAAEYCTSSAIGSR